MLEIRKKGYKNFLYISGDFKPYTASDLVILFNGNTGFLRSESGRVIFEKEGWNFLDIKVYDDTTGGNEESFSSVIDLTQRLIDLGCPAYYSDGDIVISNFVSVEDNNALTIGEDGLLYVSVTSTGSDPLKTDRGGYTGTSQDLADLIQDNTDAQNDYKSLKNLELVDLTNGGSLAVPTSGEKTTLEEITTFLNTQTFTINNEKLVILRVLFTETLDSVEYLSFAHYKFLRNNISGVWGAGSVNGVISSTDLVLDSRETITPYNTPSTITIDLGDILTDDIVTYLNGNAQPTSGQNWELLDGNSYFFVYTSNGSDITDFYKKDNKPVTLGTTGNYVVESTDFQRISTDGVIQTNIDADTLQGFNSNDFVKTESDTTQEVSSNIILSKGVPLGLSKVLKLHNPNNGNGVAVGVTFSAEGLGVAKSGVFFENKGIGNGRGILHFCVNNTLSDEEVSLLDSVLRITNLGNIESDNKITAISFTGSGEGLTGVVKSNTIGEPTGSDLVANIVSLTQAEYDAGTKVSTTIYNITDA